MNWYDHHKRNARVAYLVAAIVFSLGAGVSTYELWVNQQEWQFAILASVEFWVMSLSLLFLAFRYNQKASLKHDVEEVSQSDFFFRGQEMMVKQMAGLDLCYHYFTVEGNVLAEFKEKRRMINQTLDSILPIASFLNRTFFVTDTQGTKRLILEQKAGINSPIDLFLPTGEKIARFRFPMSLKHFRVEIENQHGVRIAEARGETFSHRFTVRDSNGLLLMEFLNMGCPSKNQEYFSMSDDLVRFERSVIEDERLYLLVMVIPAIIKMNYRK